MSIFLRLIIVIGILLMPLSSCSTTERTDEKLSSELMVQLNLRNEQIAHPTPNRLELMKSTGMMVDNLEIQRIFIHLNQKPNTSQIEELEAMRITLYLDSWIPPVGNHPTGFLLADTPIDKIEELTERDYVVRLDTAEGQLEPQAGSQPQAE